MTKLNTMKQLSSTIYDQKLQTILHSFHHLTNNECFKLSTPIDLGTCRIWSISVSPGNKIYLMDQDGQWYPLEGKDRNYNAVVESLFLKMQDLIRQRQFGLTHLLTTPESPNVLVA